jgi:hypothetical protein
MDFGKPACPHLGSRGFPAFPIRRPMRHGRACVWPVSTCPDSSSISASLKPPRMKITPNVFEAYLKCPTKCWLRSTGEPSAGATYPEWVSAQNCSYRESAKLSPLIKCLLKASAWLKSSLSNERRIRNKEAQQEYLDAIRFYGKAAERFSEALD